MLTISVVAIGIYLVFFEARNSHEALSLLRHEMLKGIKAVELSGEPKT
jgi:hypothetical protein